MLYLVLWFSFIIRRCVALGGLYFFLTFKKSEVFIRTDPTPGDNLGVKVTDLEFS